MTLLSTKGATMRFGGLVAVDDVTLDVDEGELVALVGPNGAGKSTLFNLLAGHLTPTSGTIHYCGDDITSLPPHKRARRGLVRTWQIARPFPRLDLLDNVLVAAKTNAGTRLARAAVGGWDEAAQVERAHAMLDLVGLGHMEDHLAGQLSGGQRKLLEIARGMMLDPKVLLLDEPFAGVNPTLAHTIMELLKDLWNDGLTILLVEHNMDIVMNNCPRVVVLANGKVLRDGTPDEVMNDPKIIEAYLGGTI